MSYVKNDNGFEKTLGIGEIKKQGQTCFAVVSCTISEKQMFYNMQTDSILN